MNMGQMLDSVSPIPREIAERFTIEAAGVGGGAMGSLRVG